METQKSLRKPKEYQIVGIFAILGLLTMMLVLLFNVVLFAPQKAEVRNPAYESDTQNKMPNSSSVAERSNADQNK